MSASRGDGRDCDRPSAVVWHDLECGSYTADLGLWRELADAARARTRTAELLDIGAGTGRVTLDLARRGHRVTALDRDAELLRALRDRVEATSEPIDTVCADARTLALARSDFAVCIAPMQTVQLLGGAAGRTAFLRRARAHLAPGATLACAIVTEIDSFDCSAGDIGPAPEIARVDGSIYVSRATRVHAGRRSVRIERERSILTVGEAGPSTSALAPPARDVVELDRVSTADLHREGRAAGFRAAGVCSIAATDEHTASVAVMFRA